MERELPRKSKATPEEIGREIAQGIVRGMAEAFPPAMLRPVPQAIPEVPQEWKPPTLKFIDPPKGGAAGSEDVTIEFNEALPYDIDWVKFGETPVTKIEFKPPSTTLLVTTPKSAYGQPGKVKIEIQTAYNHRFELGDPYEYV